MARSFARTKKPLNLYLVVGEVSGDVLGAQLVDAFKKGGTSINPMGMGGEKLAKHGVTSVIDTSELAVMGLSGVVAKLPKLMKLARIVANDIIEKQPDVIVLIDSPEFAKRVAKIVKKKLPDVPIVKYVCPSVWAWREHRAKKMVHYIDHILAILPFEPALMEKLEGPKTTYVGHPLAKLVGQVKAADKRTPNNPAKIILMPGSRSGEIKRLLPIIKQTVNLLEERGNVKAHYALPVVPHLAQAIEDEVSSWDKKVTILKTEKAKITAFKQSDLAIATSGTAILELAMYMVPTISVYKLDPALNALKFIIKAWTAALPNLIADKVIVPERINEYAHPQYIARLAESLLTKGHERNAQLDGYALVHKKMMQKDDPSLAAAKTILQILKTTKKGA